VEIAHDAVFRISHFASFSIVALGLVVALMLLAGHTQTAFINLVGLGVWVVWPKNVVLWPISKVRSYLANAGAQWLLLGGGVALGALLSAAQLLPTVELSQLGLRSGGLTYGEATSFSLKPLHLLWTLLPSYGLLDLGVVFDTPGYSEYVAYVGSLGLLLAIIGAWRGAGPSRIFGLLFTALGLFLALGRWNPLYYPLYRVVPGFDLFRNPARWMMLYTLGMAVLAGAGADCLLQWIKGWRLAQPQILSTQSHSVCRLSYSTLILFTALDLLVAARALPHTATTAPQAMHDVRTAPAHLLTDPVRTQVSPAAMGRFLGMSTITYDPGDLADWRRIFLESQPPQLDRKAFEQVIIALKIQELLVPNLSLLWRIPSVDGFDGGVLPLKRYNQFLTILVPSEQLVPDGRLREQIHSVPATTLLNLLNVQYLITDKVRDLWFEDRFYDRQIGAHLRPTGPTQVQIEAPVPFATTQLDLIGYIAGPPSALADLMTQKRPVAEITLQDRSGQMIHLPLSAGGLPGADLADEPLDSPMAAHSGARVAYRDVAGKRQEYLVHLPLSAPLTPMTVTVQRMDGPLDLVVQAITLVDQRTKMFTPLLPSDRGRFRLVHSGDVKIYENVESHPRAYLAYTVTGVASPEAALAALRQRYQASGAAATEPTTIVEGLDSFTTQRNASDHAEIVAYAPERVEIHAVNAQHALLVLSDSAYPGWLATVDGVPAPIYTTNYLFRGIALPPGDHTVFFHYQPRSWRIGLWLSTTGVVVALLFLLLGWRQKISQKPN
jgi:hypothetical protein